MLYTRKTSIPTGRETAVVTTASQSNSRVPHSIAIPHPNLSHPSIYHHQSQCDHSFIHSDIYDYFHPFIHSFTPIRVAQPRCDIIPWDRPESIAAPLPHMYVVVRLFGINKCPIVGTMCIRVCLENMLT